jgi:hypothetical protein
MSRGPLPDLFGLQRLRANGGALVTARKRVNLLGEVSLTDGAARTNIVVGAPAIIFPDVLTVDDSDFSPAGFETASVVILSTSNPSGVTILPRTTGILTIRRTWVNVGSYPIRFPVPEGAVSPSVIELPAGHSLRSIFDGDAESGQWIFQVNEEFIVPDLPDDYIVSDLDGDVIISDIDGEPIVVDLAAPPSSDPLTLYPAFDRDWIPYAGAAFTEPTLPTTSRSVTVSSAAQMQTEMAAGAAVITVAAATAIGAVNSGCQDCEIIIPAGSSIAWLYLANPFSAGRKYTTRLRVRGPGKLGGIQFISGAGVLTSTDIVIDGVTINPTALSTPSDGPFCNVGAPVARMMWMNCVARVPLLGDNTGNGWLLSDITDLGIFNCNVAINSSEGPTNSWICRIGGTSSRILIADNYFRKYATQQAILRQGFGTQSRSFLRNNILVSGDELIVKNEGVTYDLDEQYLDLNTIVFTNDVLSGQTFSHAAQNGTGGVTHKYTVTNTDWRATNASYVNDTVLQALENQGTHGETLSYRSGNTYTYDPTFGTLVPAWPDVTSPLTGVTLNGDPTALP